jgi:hypothetical protein
MKYAGTFKELNRGQNLKDNSKSFQFEEINNKASIFDHWLKNWADVVEEEVEKKSEPIKDIKSLKKSPEPIKYADFDKIKAIFKPAIRSSITDSDVIRWKGYITEIENDTFFANLEDLSDKNSYEVGEFKVNDIPNEDKDLFRLGAVFYLSVGYIKDRTGQVKKQKLLRFQRLPKWSEEEEDMNMDKARELFETITWD